MKKITILLLSITCAFTACKKDDKSLFDQSPDQRLNKTLEAYQSQLAGAANGWKGFITVDSGKGNTYSFYFKFNPSNRVTMYADFDSATAVTPMESSYRIKALQQPSLIFDTYSYVHLLADPNPSVNGGATGAGLGSDFEFAIESASTDTVKLTGRFNGSKAVLIRATAPEATAFNNRGLGNSLLFNNISRILTYWKRVTIGGVEYEVNFNGATRTISFNWLDASGNVRTFRTGYYYTINGVVLNNPLLSGNQTITGFNNIVWNPATSTLNVSVNNVSVTFTEAIKPLKTDLTAPKRWYDYAVNNANGYWISIDGFHANGVDDAFNINSLVSGANTYYFLIYWPKYAANNDFFGPIFLNAAQTNLTLVYGTAPAIPTFTSDGRAIFTQLGNYGTHPTTGPAGLSRNQLYSSSGYYFVQTSPTSYDMVSALDAKTWITWEF
jgi:hypothetical protein